ncbi:MAG: Ig-like domain-containing protein [Anaerolineae bacterium]
MKWPRSPIHRWLSLLVLLTVLLGACAPIAPKETPTVGEPTATPTPAPPTATPLPLPPPRLLSRTPAPGEEQPLDAPIVLTFDQPMHKASVEAAFLISPTLEGSFAWSDDRTVAFTAEKGFERGTRYQVTVDQTARNLEGTAMEEPVTFDFSTIGYLIVSQVVPGPDSEEVDPNTTVTVVFNRPVVPLASINRQAELPDPLTFMPPVSGKGEWLNTSIYLFRPDGGFLPATHYKARIAAGLSDTSGGVLAEDYVWEFTTIRPAALQFSPPSGFQYVGPTDVISVTFNQPMDRASVQTRFSLELDGQPVEGIFRWQGAATATAPETMIFVPDIPLLRSTAYSAKLAPGARARAGELAIEEEIRWEFTTVKEPGIVATSPEDGARGVSPGDSIQIVFASPMQREGFLDHLTVTPQVTPVYTSWSEFDTVVQISFKQNPAASYSLELKADTPDKYGARLGRTTRVRFTTGDLPPYATLATDGRLGTFSVYTNTVVYATYRNISRLEVGLYRLSPEAFMRLLSYWDAWDRYTPQGKELIRQWTQSVQAPRNQVRLACLDLRTGDGQDLPPGLYYLQMSAPEIKQKARDYQPSRYMFIKSALNLVLKQGRTEALVWATDLASGQPVANLPVTFYSKLSQPVSRGKTDQDGLFRSDALETKDLWDAFFAFTGEPGSPDFGVAYNGWDEGISPWNFGVDSEFWSSPYQGYVYTDRPIYRPGQTVYFKAIIRADDDARYSLPTQLRSVQVRINDPQGKELYKRTLSLNDMGTLHDQLLLSEEAPLGYYYIDIQDPAQEFYAGTGFQVAEYKKPEYQVSVTTDRDAYLGGDTIQVAAEATYYFGGPVPDADVHWSVLSSNYWFDYQCPPGQSCPWYSWSDYEWGAVEGERFYGEFGRLIAEGDAKTDDQGRVTFKVPADISKETQSQIFTIEASITDISGQQVSNRTAAVVHRGEFYIGVAPHSYLTQAGEEAQIDLLTVDWESQPVAGVPLTVVFMEHRWYSVRRQAEDGGYYWDWTTEDIPIVTTTLTTDANGQAIARFTPKKAGSYKVRAIGRDTHENEIRSAAYLWVWGGEEYVSWRRESHNRIELIADKQEYQPGDVAEILIPSPYTGTVQALVTLERSRIVETQVRELKTNSEVLRVPITEEHVPTLFVSVLIVQGSDQAPDGLATFKMGVVRLPVSVKSRELTITLTPDKDMSQGEHYGPRQTATYDVWVTDSRGQPVEAELSLRMADLAVLALADEPGPTLVETFWRNRGLGVKTTTPLVVSMEQFNRELRPRAKGGGGGEEGLVRTRFADTAFWDPVVRTGKDGKAQVTVQLPDNLTTWRMQARGVTADTKVGQAQVDVLSTLDLLVRPVLPRFFVVNDRAEIATIVHNNTSNTLDVQVNLSPEGLALEGSTRQNVTVPAGDMAKVTWSVKALPGQQAKVRMWARSGDLYDGREDTLPVYPYSTPEVVSTAGMLSEPGLRQEIVQLPRAYDPTQGMLTVQLDGSLTAATQDALTYLEHYPYECVEQTVSRFLPNVVTWQALKEMDLDRPELEQKLAQMVGVGLQRLYNEQHYDGGWGWWVSDKSDAFLTAYVLQGLLEAHRAAFVVDQEVMNRAVTFLRDNLPSVSRVDEPWEANRLAYQLYVLADYYATLKEEAGGQLGLAIRLFDKRHLLSHYGKAFLAAALDLLEPEERARLQTLLGDLSGDAVVSATGTHWEEAKPDYWNMNTDIRSTAIVLWAMSRLEPTSELLPNIVRWLMAMRQEGYWQTTQNTAWTLLALVGYMRASGELEGDFDYAVYLNGEQWVSGQVSKETITESRKLQIEVARLLVDQGNRLVLERLGPQGDQTGKGKLYYSASLRYYLPADQVKALDRGIIIARQYSPVDQPDRYVDQAQVGDVIRVKLIVIAPTDLYYVVVEDPLPAGCEGVDLSLKTTSVVGERPELRNVTAEQEDRWYRRYGWGWWWFSSSELRDEKVVLFAQYLPRGTYEYTYLMRAGVPGQFLVMPATAYEMYFPEVFGRSDGGRFIVEAGE